MRNYGFNTTIKNYDKLVKIFAILDDKIEIDEDKTLILPDNYKELIGNLQSYLSKDFYKYQSKIFNKAKTRSEYDKELEEKKRVLEEEKRKKEKELIRQKELKEKIKKLCQGMQYRDKEWIEKHIGIYYTWDNALEYFWTIIGDNYFQKWNGEILLTKETFDKIQKINDSIVGLRGRTFLSRKFKVKGYSHSISFDQFMKKETVKPTSYGVYGIYKDGALMYIGSTMRDFQVRFEEHIQNIEMKNNELYIYSLLDDGDISFKKLIDVATLKTNSQITRRDVESMELGLIALYAPPGNVAGKCSEFKYKEE